jgi:hypothetical protein
MVVKNEMENKNRKVESKKSKWDKIKHRIALNK